MELRHEDRETRTDIVEIEPDIRPFWELDNRNLRDDRGDDLEDKLLEVESLIATHRTFCLIIIEKIDDELPRFENRFDEHIELDPSFESYPILAYPSTHHHLDGLDITEDLRRIAFFPGEVFLEFGWELAILLDDTDIFFERIDECVGLDNREGVRSCGSPSLGPFGLFILIFFFVLLEGQFRIKQPFVWFL
ncbi:MAG: hypothetical protein ACD_78C00459G0002 [uncultured bacterium (gcode 4)]|uniref:Uncharacterized protein n=1 Tax=uncultured bacterium (gcode 4) TaxID=1234023 RepID=K1XVM1_9BACT|nr:MAG: hypothetical protein ACD_78C00459G0002 [uncultured bacterium (gcode 4)]